MTTHLTIQNTMHITYYNAPTLGLFVCSRYKCIIICIYLIICTYIMYRLSVCLFHIQSCAAARNASKRSVPADVSLKCILTGQACDYLPHVRRLSSNCFILGLDMLFCFHVSYYKASILSLFVCSRYKCIYAYILLSVHISCTDY